MTRNGLRRFFGVVWISGVLTCALLPLSSFAALYVETGLGVGEIKSLDHLYTQSSGSTGLGLGLNFTVADALGSASNLIQFQFGFQQRATSASESGSTYNLLTTYPLIRLETSRCYFGFGATPMVAANKGSLGSYSRISGATAFLGEAGLLWRVVPFFNLALEGSAESINHGGQTLAAQGTFQMRFFFGEGNKTSGHRKYDGWRYPFGIELF